VCIFDIIILVSYYNIIILNLMEIEFYDSINKQTKNDERNLEKNNINNILTSKKLSNNNGEIILTNNKIISYDHSKKMELVKKINKIKKKEYLIDIFKIITTETKDYTENNNGIFLLFHNLSDETYEKVESFVNIIYKMHKISTINTSIFNSEISENINNLSDFSENSTIDKNLSNKEKVIMRRKKYEQYLNHNQD